MAEFICTSCGSQAGVKKVTPGNFLIEVILWLCFLVPGLIYSIWRIGNKRKVCRACGKDSIIPADSPMAKALQATMGGNAPKG